LEYFMSFCLFADTEPPRGLAPFLSENWLVLLPCVLGFAAIYLLLPKAGRAKPIWGGALAALALVLGAAFLIRTDTITVESLLFFAFAGIAIAAGVLMIAQSNPVHAALSFALVVLSTCGLFLLLAAPFLMAATIIIYAGAIVVTFLFVIMLAQQEGVSNADRRSREPFLASLAGCVLLASLLCVLQKTYHTADPDGVRSQLRQLGGAQDASEVKRVLGDWAEAKDGARTSEFVKKLLHQYPEDDISDDIHDLNHLWNRMASDPIKYLDPLKYKAKAVLAGINARLQRQGSLALDRVPGREPNKAPSHFPPGKLPAANVNAVGRTLFTDYLVPVELAATLLLVATIGAIVIAGRRSEELR
jgi:NADH-quinone oxidoreductase subunit J